MWFGNLVTLEWWDDIWLNEGFARNVEHHIIDNIRPDFQVSDKFLKEIYLVAFKADLYYSYTHPVKAHISDPDRLIQIFDAISYAKGSVICRMLNGFVGSDTIF